MGESAEVSGGPAPVQPDVPAKPAKHVTYIIDGAADFHQARCEQCLWEGHPRDERYNPIARRFLAELDATEHQSATLWGDDHATSSKDIPEV